MKFQVVPPCGGHLFSQMILRFPIRVSSRAPVWGASCCGSRGSCEFCCFKSCPRVGGIPLLQAAIGLLAGFKSCPRVGGIRDYRAISGRGTGFQVVPPCGGHPTLKLPTGEAYTFQVVPPCGGHLAVNLL